MCNSITYESHFTNLFTLSMNDDVLCKLYPWMLSCAIRNNKLIQLFVWVGNLTFIKESNPIKVRKRKDNVEQLPLLLSTNWFFKVFFATKKPFDKNNIILKHLSKLIWHTYGILIIILCTMILNKHELEGCYCLRNSK